MNQKSDRTSWPQRALFAWLAALVAGGSAFAQPATTSTGGTGPQVLEKFEVTGSYIPIAGTVTAIPVTTIDAAKIENSGVTTNLLEVLRKTTPQFTGNGNLGSTNANIASGNTGGGSQLAFRNTQTLVLINGRRLAYAPILASGGFQFVDVNLIPLSAVEKVEVLQDGASAIYGTDAVSGVVNIRLRSDFQGMEFGGRYGFSDNDGNYAERKGWVVAGAGTDKTKITLSAEWTRTDPLFQYDREFSNPAYGTGSFAGVVSAGTQFYVLNPSLNAPPMNQDLTAAQLVANNTYIPVNSSNLISGLGTEAQYSFNLANYVTLLLGNERQAATLNFDHKWTNMVSVFGDLMYSQTKTYSQLNAQPTTATMAANDPRNPFNVSVVARNRFVTEPRQYFYDTTNIRGLIGMDVQLNPDWKLTGAALNNRIEQNYRNKGLIDTAARIAAVSGGILNYFAREQAPGAIQRSGMFGVALGQGVSELETYDARVSGTIFQLPAGPVGFATGVEWRTEKLTQTADRGSQSDTFSWDTATTLDPFDADRDVNAYFVNVRVPLLGKTDGGMLLEVEAALRHEKYSDTDDPTVPKYTVRYLPFNEEFAVRGSYSESFAAPTLPQLFGPGGIGFTESLILRRAGGGPNITGQANARSGSNKNLKPATSENWNFGLVYSPKAVRGLSTSIGYFNVEQAELISTIGSDVILQDVELNGPASPYAQFVRRGPRGDTSQFTAGQPITAIGQIGVGAIDDIYVTDTLVNIAYQKLAGFDFNVDYTWTNNLGRFDASLAGIWWDFYRFRALPGDDEEDTVGKATSFNGTIPDWQTYGQLSWTKGKFGATLGHTYIPSVEDENAYDPDDSSADAHVEAFHSVDVSFRYTFGNEARWLSGMQLRVGANNVFNEKPPSAKGTFTESNADIATYGAIGRLIFVEARFRF